MSVRIAFCITSLDTGGAERQLVELVTRMPRDRFEPIVAALAPPPTPPRDGLVRRLRDASIPVEFFGARYLWQAPFVYRRLKHWLHKNQPRLVQCFLAHANVLGAYAAHRLQIHPIVTGIRVAEQRSNWHLPLQRLTARYVDRQVCVSKSVADFACNVMRLPDDRVVVIPNGIDLEEFADIQPIPLGELGLADRQAILFVARLESDKRPMWLLDRMPEIIRRLPTHDLVVAGDGPLRDAVAQQAARLGIAQRVHLVGWRPDVRRLIAAANLLVLTSSSEGMSNAILEAMAAARPVVTTDVHGVRELLGDEHGGQIILAGDGSAFVDAVVRIASDSETARRLGQHNRVRVEQMFSIDRTAAAYVALYETLLAPKNR